MPNFDMTGPNRQGAMTGGKRGVCASPEMEDSQQNSTFCGRGQGRGRGRGRGRNNGQGRGRQRFLQTAQVGAKKTWFSSLTQYFRKKKTV